MTIPKTSLSSTGVILFALLRRNQCIQDCTKIPSEKFLMAHFFSDNQPKMLNPPKMLKKGN